MIQNLSECGLLVDLVISFGALVGGPNTDGVQRLKLVRRPTERDIFWDETTGERLDPSCLLDPKSVPRLCEERQRDQPHKQLLCRGEDGIQRDRAQGPRNREERSSQARHRTGLSLDKNLSTEREMVRVEDGGKTQRESWRWPEWEDKRCKRDLGL